MNTRSNELNLMSSPGGSQKPELKAFNFSSTPDLDQHSQKLNSVHLKCTKRIKNKFPKHSYSILPSAHIKRVKFQQKLNTTLTFIISCLVIGGSLYESEVVFQNNYQLGPKIDTISLLIACLAVVEVVLVIIYYLNLLKIKISHKILSKHSAMYQDKEILSRLFFELVICVVITPPYASCVIQTRQINVVQTLSLNDILLVLIFLKTYYLLKFLYEFSYFNSIKSQFYLHLLMVDNKFVFTMRAILKNRPYSSIFLIVFLTSSIYGALLHTYEESVLNSPFISYWNSVWLISYTQSTIGYGDIVPQTHLGRTVIAATISMGYFLYSYMTVVVKNNTTLTIREYELYSEIKTKRITAKKLHNISVVLIQRWWKLILHRKKKHNSVFQLNELSKQIRVFSYYRIQFHQEKAQTLYLCISKIMDNPMKKMKNLSKSFESIEKSEMLSLKLANLNYSRLQKIKKYNKELRKVMVSNTSPYKNDYLEVVSRDRRASRTLSRANLHRLKSEAIKNMMKKKYSKSIVSFTQRSASVSVVSEKSESQFN